MLLTSPILYLVEQGQDLGFGLGRQPGWTEMPFAVSIELLGNLLDLLAFHERDIGHRFSRVQRRCRAHRAIAGVRLRGSLYSLV